MDVLSNWLVQGSALAAATTVLLRVLPRLSATTRYRVWWVALLTVLALPVLNWIPAHPITQPAAAITAASAYEVEMPALTWWPIAIALVAYALWTSWCLVRIGRALLHLRAAKRRCRELPLRRQNRLQRWSALRDQGRRARLVVSEDVRWASVLGLTSPAIAVAPVLLRVLQDDELDCILVHEWAHVQRRDDLARLLQVLVRAITGLHPAIWWIDRQLHTTRETACDDWTVNLTGSAKRYAACLTKLAGLNLTMGEAVLLPAVLSPTDLTSRVTRLLDRRRSTSTKQPVTVTALSLTLFVALGLFVAGIQLIRTRAPEMSVDIGSRAVAVPPQSLTPDTPTVEPASAPNVRRPVPHRPREIAMARTTQSVAATNDTKSALPSPAAQGLDPIAVQSMSEAPVVVLSGVASPVGELHPTPGVPVPPEMKPGTPWGAAADAGASAGKGSKEAGVATAGFFSRLGKSIARRF
jgi:beta-lactamase regulating signal transducer with metallopeptidase domain